MAAFCLQNARQLEDDYFMAPAAGCKPLGAFVHKCGAEPV